MVASRIAEVSENPPSRTTYEYHDFDISLSWNRPKQNLSTFGSNCDCHMRQTSQGDKENDNKHHQAPKDKTGDKTGASLEISS